MKKLIFQEKGSLFIITLNVIIILTIFLFSFSFTSMTRYRLLSNESKRYQAYLNAKSGMVLALKELKEGKLTIPVKKQYTLFNDEQYQVEVKMDYAAFAKSQQKMEIHPVSKSDIISITSTGKFKGVEWKITTLKKNNQILLYYSE